MRPDAGTGRPVITGPGPESIPAQAAAWARRNGCGPGSLQRQIASDVALSSYPCPAGGAVEFHSIIDGGHTWPGNPSVGPPVPLVGAITTSISADEIVWDFFLAHPLEGPCTAERHGEPTCGHPVGTGDARHGLLGAELGGLVQRRRPGSGRRARDALGVEDARQGDQGDGEQ